MLHMAHYNRRIKVLAFLFYYFYEGLEDRRGHYTLHGKMIYKDSLEIKGLDPD